MGKDPVIIKIASGDNVGIVANPGGLEAQTKLDNNIRLKQFIPMGHKVALLDIAENDGIIRYGQLINTMVIIANWQNRY